MYDHTFLNLQPTRSDISTHIKWIVSLVIAYGHLFFLRGLCGYIRVNILTLSPTRVHTSSEDTAKGTKMGNLKTGALGKWKMMGNCDFYDYYFQKRVLNAHTY